MPATKDFEVLKNLEEVIAIKQRIIKPSENNSGVLGINAFSLEIEYDVWEIWMMAEL